MDRRRRRRRRNVALGVFLAAVAVAAIAVNGWLYGPWGQASRSVAEAGSLGYGAYIPAAASDSSVGGASAEGCQAGHAVDRSGMSGSEAKSHTHGNQAGTMWCDVMPEGASASIAFDLGGVVPLGEMWVWNYNEQENDSPLNAERLGRGLRQVQVFLSADGHTWEEWRGAGYPFRLAKADGSDRLRATNLDDGRASPIRFGGEPARYVKVTADPTPGEGNWSDTGERAFGLGEVRFYRYAREVVYGGEIVPVGASDGKAGPGIAGGDEDGSGASSSAVEGVGAATAGDGIGAAGLEEDGIGGASTADGGMSDPGNAVNRYGMSGDEGRKGRHGHDAKTMWLHRAGPDEGTQLVVDLGGTYPLGEMWVWNYNGVDEDGTSLAARGLRDVGIFYSIDGNDWAALKGEDYPYRFAQAGGSASLAATNLADGHAPVDFGGVPARYVKLIPQGGAGEGNWGASEDGGQALYGLSELRFFCGEGVAAEPAPEWTGLFSRYDGWTGADGIYSIPLDGVDAIGAAAAADAARTVFLFSDTYAGRVNAVSGMRESEAIVNNSVAMLRGAQPDPSAIAFEWAPQTADLSLFTPHTPAAAELPGSWYWLQDGIALDGKLYLFPLLMVKDPAQPPGFQFAIRGVAMAAVPMTADGKPDYANMTQTDAPLYRRMPDGSEIVFGAGVLDNSEAAGAPSPDGHIYVYGYRNETDGTKRLLAARTTPSAIDDWSVWRYWDGSGWSAQIEAAAPLQDGVSPELSVTPMKEGRWKGKYLLISELNSVSGTIVYAVGETPAGPFGPMTPIYAAPEPARGQEIITYNAKAHPHLSSAGELLVTYNVNTTNLAANTNDADIYRPRWIRIREIPAE